jgi:hypothetical protein
MALTNAGKDYIASKFGINNCMVNSGLQWTTYGTGGTSSNESGGTAQIVARLVTSAITRVQITSPSSQGGSYTNTDLVSNNQNQAVTYADASWITNNDGYPSGEAQHCVGTSTSTPTTVPTNTPAPTVLPPGHAGYYTFHQGPTGSPNVTLNTNDVDMKQSDADYHFEIDDLFVTNNSANKCYVAVRCKLFQGQLGSCPSSGEVFDGMDRVSTSRNVRIKILDPGEMELVNADFYQPAHILGVHTVCIIVHGSFNKESLEAEVAGISG